MHLLIHLFNDPSSPPCIDLSLKLFRIIQLIQTNNLHFFIFFINWQFCQAFNPSFSHLLIKQQKRYGRIMNHDMIDCLPGSFNATASS